MSTLFARTAQVVGQLRQAKGAKTRWLTECLSGEVEMIPPHSHGARYRKRGGSANENA